jgi:hypothetical protein
MLHSNVQPLLSALWDGTHFSFLLLLPSTNLSSTKKKTPSHKKMIINRINKEPPASHQLQSITNKNRRNGINNSSSNEK